MVRLKESLRNSTPVDAKFQFLNGAIKSTTLVTIDSIPTVFQFLNGAIKRVMVFRLKVLLFNFNSSMVRLKGRKVIG